ncbi:hypothetical protein [Streptomyces sp. NPDC047453]|uniref:hypothetical protein n=1 Tax=Streptomyces sp. NPDC047453 TaxID=3154812 RepID=UPI0033DF51CE
MQPPVIAALIASGFAIATNAVGWGVAIRLNSRTANTSRKQWRRETRRDAYADLVTSFQKLCEIFGRTPRAKGLAEGTDEYVTGEMDDALMDLYAKATVVRFEGPDPMRGLAVDSVECSDRLVLAWQESFLEDDSKITMSLEAELVRARDHLKLIIAEAESILQIRD